MKTRERKTVSINISKKYFDSIFEPARRRLEKIKRVSFSQPKFTEYLTIQNIKINIPKTDRKLGPSDYRFAPKFFGKRRKNFLV